MNKYILLFPMLLAAAMLVFPVSCLAVSSKPQLGVYLQELNDNLREHFAYRGNGVLITEVIEDTGADKAGLKIEDIIIKINGETIYSIQDLQSIVKKTRPGDKVEVDIFRDKSKKTILLEITEKKPRLARHYPRKWIRLMRNDHPRIGIHIQDLNPQLAEFFKVNTGVLIMEILQDSPAEKAKLQAGDVIVAWNEHNIADTKDLYNQLNKSKSGDEIELTVVRKGKKMKPTILLAEPANDDNHLFGFSFDEDDSGDLIFRLRNRRMHTWPHFYGNIEVEGEKKRKWEKSDNKNHEREMEQIREELHQLKKELKELQSK